MTLPLFKNQFRADQYGPRTSAASIGSTLIVANTNSGQLNTWGTSGLGDPWLGFIAQSDSEGLLSSDNTSDAGYVDDQGLSAFVPGHQFIRPIRAAGWNYANFYHIWRGNNTVTTAPRIMVYGRLPKPSPTMLADGTRAWPNDDDSDFPPLQEQWIPLTQPGETVTYLELPTAAGGHYLNRQFISAPAKYVYLQGVEEILVMVVQAAAFSNTQLVTMSSGGSTDTDLSSSSSAGSDTSYGVIGVQFSG